MTLNNCLIMEEVVPHQELAPKLRDLDHLQDCGASLRVNPACIRVLRGRRTERAGLGHQLSEMVFFIHMSALHAATFAAEPFRRARSDHGTSYEFVNKMLGLNSLFSGQDFSGLRVESMSNVEMDLCGVTLDGGYLDCPGGDCFSSPVMMGAFRRYTPCLQVLSHSRGTWPAFNPYSPSLKTLNVVWHVRVGDRAPHSPDDEFFKNLFQTLYLYTKSTGKDCQHHLIGEWGKAGRGVKERYRVLFQEFLHGQRLRILDLDVKNSLLYMLHSDLLIGSGSSLSDIVPLFSHKPLYVNVQPKHGWNFLAEIQDNALIANSSGFIVTPISHFKSLMEAKGDATIK